MHLTWGLASVNQRSIYPYLKDNSITNELTKVLILAFKVRNLVLNIGGYLPYRFFSYPRVSMLTGAIRIGMAIPFAIHAFIEGDKDSSRECKWHAFSQIARGILEIYPKTFYLRAGLDLLGTLYSFYTLADTSNSESRVDPENFQIGNGSSLVSKIAFFI